MKNTKQKKITFVNKENTKYIYNMIFTNKEKAIESIKQYIANCEKEKDASESESQKNTCEKYKAQFVKILDFIEKTNPRIVYITNNLIRLYITQGWTMYAQADFIESASERFGYDKADILTIGNNESESPDIIADIESIKAQYIESKKAKK